MGKARISKLATRYQSDYILFYFTSAPGTCNACSNIVDNDRIAKSVWKHFSISKFSRMQESEEES